MDTGCVVDDSSHTTMRLIIDFDVERATETVLKIPQSGVTGTDKAVFAIARGSGSGKSRVVKEIRRNLLRRDKMLPVDITFNYKSGNEQENVWSEASAGRRSARLEQRALEMARTRNEIVMHRVRGEGSRGPTCGRRTRGMSSCRAI